MTHPRDTAGVIAPPPFIFLAFLVAGWLIDRQMGTLGLGLDPTLRKGLALGLIVAGLLLEMWAGGMFRKAGTRIVPYQPSTALVTDGPYRFSRNPMYVGFALTYLGLALGLASAIALALLPVCLIVVHYGVIKREERYMERLFGQAYLDYRRRVRRWL